MTNGRSSAQAPTPGEHDARPDSTRRARSRSRILTALVAILLVGLPLSVWLDLRDITKLTGRNSERVRAILREALSALDT